MGRHRGESDDDKTKPPEVKDGLLSMTNWDMEQLPSWWPEHTDKLAKSVTTLTLKGNLFTSVPDVSRLRNLKELNLSGNELASLSASGLPPSLIKMDAVNNKLTSVDAAVLTSLPKLNILDLAGNHLTVDGFEGVASSRLEALDLSSNHLVSLPESVLQMTSLTALRLNMNPLATCPELSCMNNLLFLGLARCGLSELPAEIVTSIPRLATLDVARNTLDSLPSPGPKCELNRLFAAYNRFTELPVALMKLPLVEVDFSHNMLAAWPVGLGSGGVLERINLAFNEIPSLPAAASLVASSEGLQEFFIDHNAITSVSNAVKIECSDFNISRNPFSVPLALKKLNAQSVAIAHLGLTSLPLVSSRCETLHAPGNQLQTFDWASLSPSRTSLRNINLSDNLLSSLPEQIGSCPNLLELQLGYNQLSSLPASCAKLSSLVCLVLSGNQYAAVPEPVLSMRSLQWLHLANNKLTTLPSNLPALTKLQSLLVNDNLLSSVDVPLPDSLLELDISHNSIIGLPQPFHIPNGSEFWGADDKAKAVMAEIAAKEKAEKGGGGFFGCCGRRTAVDDVIAPTTPHSPPTHASHPPPRRPHKLRKNLQPFRMYIHGNPMDLPSPYLMAHKPLELPPPAMPPKPLGRHPRGSGQLTVTEYDGAIWPSEAALHAEMRANEQERQLAASVSAGMQPSPSSASGDASTTGSAAAVVTTRRLGLGVAEMMGRRIRMEDAVYVMRCFRGRESEALLAVYDAHSGSDVAEVAAAEYAKELHGQLGDGDLGPASAVEAAMAEAYWQVNESCKRKHAVGGAVAVVVLLQLAPDGSALLFCSNVGDARAVLCRTVTSSQGDGKGHTAVRLSRDFKPFDDDEYERITGLGGFVSLRDGGRVCDDLALTRALGDLHIAKYIEPRPHFNMEVLAAGECPFFIIGCDGVWDVLRDEDAVRIVNHCAPEYTRGAAALRDLAFCHGSTDNISAMVVDLSPLMNAVY